MSSTTRKATRFHHEAFFYGDREEFLDGVLSFLRPGLEAEEAILVALPAQRLELLKDALGPDQTLMRFAEMEELGRNPARIIPAWREFLDAGIASGRGVRGIGEPIWAERSDAELDECDRHESLLNLAFDGTPGWSLMCPYDTQSLSESVIEGAERNHPVVCGGHGRCTEYSDPALSHQVFRGELEEPAELAAEFEFTEQHLREVRRLVSDHAERAGLRDQRLEDLVIAANEIAANSVRHGGGAGNLRIWFDERRLACDFRDRGRIEQPLIGRVRPDPMQVGGRGMWLANQLCDLVQIRWQPPGSLIRLQMSL